MKERVALPALIKNNLNMVRYVGNVRFGALETRNINRVVYNRNKKYFDEALDTLIDNDKYVLSIIDKEEKVAEVKNEKSDDDKQESSVIRQYAAEGLHWRKAVSYIEEISDIVEAERLFKEGLEMKLPIDSAVMKSLKSVIEGLRSFV